MNRSTTTRPTPASTAWPERRVRHRALAALCGLAVAGCASYGPGDLGPGRTEGEVRARMGEPTERAALPGGGVRLDYGRGPYGHHTWRVVVDASGRVVSVSQLLTERNFDGVTPGDTVEAVRDRIGPPSERRTGWRGVGEVWSWRLDSPMCRWFQVWFVVGRVRETSYDADPMCDDARRPED